MEEGPEPHEWVEKTVEHEHHQEGGHGAGDAKHAMMIPAITAATLAVCAAFGSLLSGHAVNESILHQTKATDHWAYYQAKSTKENIYEANKEVVKEIVHALKAEGSKAEPNLELFQKKVEKYEHEKEEIKKQAEELEKHSEHEFHKHQRFALGIASFQVGIVLASVFILVRQRFLFVLSLTAGGIGFVFLILGLLY